MAKSTKKYINNATENLRTFSTRKVYRKNAPEARKQPEKPL